MKRFGSVRDERGVTLVELLGTIVIFTVVMAGIYGLFAVGLKMYNSITMEERLRTEADYIVSMIMNELYSSDYDDVRYNADTKQLELYSRKRISFEKDDLTYSYSPSDAPAAVLSITNGHITLEKGATDNKTTVLFQQEQTITLQDTSSIGVICSRQENVFYKENDNVLSMPICSSGIVQLTFVFQAGGASIQPLTLTSEIGF